MSPLFILITGMAIVVGGILIFRLHAFLALIAGGLIVAALTPPEDIYNYKLSADAISVTEFQDHGKHVLLNPRNKQKIIEGQSALLRRNKENNRLEYISDCVITQTEPNNKIHLYAIAPGQPNINTDDDLLLIHHTRLADARSTSKRNIAEHLAGGFGNTCLKIGIMIAMASIIGRCLMISGAAERIIIAITGFFGIQRTPIAFIASGFTLGIPVFFDTVFYLLIPLAKAMYRKTKENYLLYVLCTAAGAAMAHSLVPPTPGPLFVAYELGVDIGLAIIVGIIIGIFTVTAGYIWAKFINKRMTVSLDEIVSANEGSAKLREISELPGLFSSLLPIILPLLLLAGGTVFSMLYSASDSPSSWMLTLKPIISILSNKDIALTLAAVCGLLLLASRPEMNRKEIAGNVQSAISDAGTIVLITAAGGAFGHVLRQTDIASSIGSLLPTGDSSLMILGFVMCMIVRTAQGSSTVAMITAVGIIAPLVSTQTLPYNPVYIAVAIGCGSKPISWMNDSGFWVISRMSGLTEPEMLKANTTMGVIMAFTGLAICLIGASIFPMI